MSWGVALALALGAQLSLLQADEPTAGQRAELEGWITTQEGSLPRDAEALVRWRRAIPSLEAELERCSKLPAPLGPRALALWSALGTRPAAFPEGPLRARVLRRVQLLARLEAGSLGPLEVKRLSPPAVETLRELAGDPLGGAWRPAALRALGGRIEGRETLRRVAAGGGPSAVFASRGLVSLGDAQGLFLGLDSALTRGDAGQAQLFLERSRDLAQKRPLDRVRSLLRGKASLQVRATLARAVGALGWRELQGVLRRLLREPGLEGNLRVGVSAAYLRLGGTGDELGQALISELCTASLESGPGGREAFLGLATLPPTLAAGALGAELRRSDLEGARRARAIHAAEALGLTQLAPTIRRLFRDRTQPHLARAAAAHALGTFADPEDQTALVLLGRDAGAGLRRGALAALVRIPRARRITAVSRAIADALGDEEPAIRQVALGALEAPADLPVLRAGLAKARPSLVSEQEVLAWLERAADMSLKDAAPAEWLLARWRSRPELASSLPLARATLAYARTLSAPVAVPALLELLEHPREEAARGAQGELTRRFPSGQSFGRSPASWVKAWREQPALFR